MLQIHWRLARVTIENQPYAQILKRYDRPHTFFYLDPPYYGIKKYRFNFQHEDFSRLAELLGWLKGKFLMSLNDHKEVRRIFREFRVQPVPVRYSCMREPGSRGRTRGELLIRNY